jgi:catechol 2,3-dioxygenase-like lactoylglutathione lyase family enzyme
MSFQLSESPVITFVSIVDVDRARSFYGSVLGLRHVADELPFALVFDCNGIMLRLAVVREPANVPGTVLGWKVANAGEAVQALKKQGVRFERYTFVQQDENDIWTTPTGAKVAWFKDPDGNLLSVSEHPERR